MSKTFVHNANRDLYWNIENALTCWGSMSQDRRIEFFRTYRENVDEMLNKLDREPVVTSPREQNYIICIGDDYYEIHGPFGSLHELRTYGHLWQHEHDDDPRWQSVSLECEAPPRFVRVTPERQRIANAFSIETEAKWKRIQEIEALAKEE